MWPKLGKDQWPGPQRSVTSSVPMGCPRDMAPLADPPSPHLPPAALGRPSASHRWQAALLLHTFTLYLLHSPGVSMNPMRRSYF